MKRAVGIIYVTILVCLGAATIIEKYEGTEFVSSHIYGSWWMCALWVMLIVCGLIYIINRRMRRMSIVTLHLSFVVILAGALLTHLTSHTGMVHLRQGEQTSQYMEKKDKETVESQLPYSLRLDSFELLVHEGTNAPSDYISHITVVSGSDSLKADVSMNSIYSRNNTRLYQTSYDEDLRGSVLTLNSDPWGIPFTYTGYGLLFISLIWILIDPRGGFRRLLRHPLLKKGVVMIAITLSFCAAANIESRAASVLPASSAEEFCRINVLYNDRICPLQTYALDFTKKLYGKRSYNGMSAEQVMTGFLFWPDEWMQEEIIKVKEDVVRDRMGFGKYISARRLFEGGHGYVLGPYLQNYYGGSTDKFYEGVGHIDEKIGLIMELRSLSPLKVFPFTYKGQTTWYSPADQLPLYMEKERGDYIKKLFDYFKDEAIKGKSAEMSDGLSRLTKYQHQYGGQSIPSSTRLGAEYLYNSIPFATILFMVNLTLGFLCLFHTIYLLTRRRDSESRLKKPVMFVEFGLMSLSFTALSICIALRWIIRGTIPMSNGYETMLVMAWFVMLASLLLFRRFRIILTFGFLLSGFFLLVSHISQMDPQITHLMPVLSSPLLTIHVSVIMMAYALLGLTFICGLMALLLRWIRGKNAGGLQEQLESLKLLSSLFLYPSISAMGFGIFIGAIWANVSWGTYWSWDPKETWALITFMAYAIAVHKQSLPWLRKPLNYHLFMVLAFLTILMTYFGVNYFLGGMHSYA